MGPRPAKPKAVKTPRPTPNKEKTPRPIRDTKPPKKTPRPTSATYLRDTTTTTYIRTPKPTTAKPTEGGAAGWGEPKPSHAEMIAVEMNGSYAQTEIIGLLSIATVLVICGCLMCKQREVGNKY